MALNNGIYENNGTVLFAQLHVLQLGAEPLIYNVNGPATSDSFPFMESKNVFRNVALTADTWGGATASIEVSLDGVTNWMPLKALDNTVLSGISTNTYAAVVLRDVFVRGVISGTGTNVSVVIC